MRLDLPVPRASADFLGLWLVEPTRFPGVLELARLESITPGARRAPEPAEPAVAAGRGVARVLVRGTMMKGQPLWSGTSTVRLRNEIRAAAADPGVSAILLEVDSPGGTVAGTADLAREVRDARRKKPVWAHVDDLAASAAYWVASQADQVWANDRTALVGSIGTVLTVYDQSAMAEREGVRPLVFSTGPLKGAGVAGAPVDDEQRAYFQGLVDDAQASFDAAVRSGRGLSAAELAAVRTGGVFPAARAVELKLIDGIRPLDKTVEALARAK